MAELVVANATVAAGSFNPTVFNQHWLVQQGVISAEDLQIPGSMFMDVMVQAQSRDFTLVVLPQQLQVVARTPPSFPAGLVQDKISLIARLLPATPFQAIGLNFVWRSDPLADPGGTVRALFANQSPLYKEFDVEDARFGAYLSKKVGHARMRLDVRPTKPTAALLGMVPAEDEGERLQFSFNFERPLLAEVDKVGAIAESVADWERDRMIAEHIVQVALGDRP